MSIVHVDKIWVKIAKNFDMRTSGGGGVVSDFGHPGRGGRVKKGQIFAAPNTFYTVNLDQVKV